MKKCSRCGAETNTTIMSMFNTQEICIPCKDKEKEDPEYKRAETAELEACRKGDFNFKGIGYKG